MNLLKTTLFLILILLSFDSNAKVCVIPIIKTMDDLVKKIKICDKGDKLYINYDSKIIAEELIVNLCSLRDTVIFKEVQMEEVKSTKKKVQKVQKSQQKSTLGDMDELIALKESMDKKEKKGK